MYCLFCDVPCIVCVYMCTEQLPPGGNPIAVKYNISYIYMIQFSLDAVRTIGHALNSGFLCGVVGHNGFLPFRVLSDS